MTSQGRELVNNAVATLFSVDILISISLLLTYFILSVLLNCAILLEA